MKHFAIIITTVILEFFGSRCLALTDLSHPLNGDTMNWTPAEKFALTDQVMIDNPPSFYATNSFVAPEHCGTHLDAPYHFNKYGWKVDEITLSHLVCPGTLYHIVLKRTMDLLIVGRAMEKSPHMNIKVS